jgi:hypothetical protein
VNMFEQRTGAGAQGTPAEKRFVNSSPRVSGSTTPPFRVFRGAEAAALAMIILAVLAVLFTGLRTGMALIGDEVTHYFMLRHQATLLPQPAFIAEIPNAWSDAPEIRCYPHPNGWHYLGAILARMTGARFWGVQAYHTLYWLQLLLVSFFWSRARGGAWAGFLVTVVLASIPMNLLFSVAFYQDIPMAAQAVTAFYLLDTRRPILGALFMVLTLWMKVTGIIFVPPFLVLAAHRQFCGSAGQTGSARGGWRQGLVLLTLAGLIGTGIYGNSIMLKKYAGSHYYPAQQIRRILDHLTAARPSATTRPEPAGAQTAMLPHTEERKPESPSPRKAEIIANHPGDLRNPRNILVYGGGLIWLVMIGGALGLARPRGVNTAEGASRAPAWPLAVGIFYAGVTAIQLRTAPDARFFLPALPFIIMSFSEWCMRLPKARWLLIVAAALSIPQGALVLNKTIQMRSVEPAVQEAIEYLRGHPPEYGRVFMYPEGNYRLFPVRHEWYLGYLLRDFWRGDNGARIELLKRHRIGAIVIKKHLISEVDENITDLGVYPSGFVRDIRADSRFVKEFENSHIVIFRVPKATDEKAADSEDGD